MTPRHGICWAAAITSATLPFIFGTLSGCQSLGAVLTVVDLQMEVQTHGKNAPLTGTTYMVRENPQSRIPFDYPGYRDEFLEWTIQTPLDGIAVGFTNHTASDMLLRWDQSVWSSSDHPSPIPLRAYRLSTGYLGSQTVFIDTDAGATAVQPVALALESGAFLKVNLRPDWTTLFPEGLLFGIQRVDKGYGFIDDGIGRWLELELPVEMNEERWVYHIRLTVRDIAQWTSYH